MLGRVFITLFLTSLFFAFGQIRERDVLNWETQEWKSEQEKAFWLAIPDWGERRTDHYRFRYNQDGERIQYFQTNGYSGYAKGYFFEEGVGFYKMVVQVKNGWITLKKVWHPNGEKHILRSYSEGVLNGRYIDWHSNGVRLLDGMTKNGKKEGFWKEWHPNGQKREEGEWKEGKAHGIFEEWYPTGKKANEQVLKMGFLDTGLVWKPDGSICKDSRVVKGAGQLLKYNQEGMPLERCEIKSGKRVPP